MPPSIGTSHFLPPPPPQYFSSQLCLDLSPGLAIPQSRKLDQLLSFTVPQFPHLQMG